MNKNIIIDLPFLLILIYPGVNYGMGVNHGICTQIYVKGFPKYVK